MLSQALRSVESCAPLRIHAMLAAVRSAAAATNEVPTNTANNARIAGMDTSAPLAPGCNYRGLNQYRAGATPIVAAPARRLLHGRITFLLLRRTADGRLVGD